MKKSAAVAELKANLSRYLKRVKAGEEILVTERNVAVARIVPVTALASQEDRLRELERAGLAKAGPGKLPGDFWKLPRGRDAKGLTRRAVADERESGW